MFSYNNHVAKLNANPNSTPNMPRPIFTAPEPGNSFATLAVPPTDAKLQLAAPQLYPVGQHPGTGPAFVPHKNHPEAHDPVVAAGTPLAGTTTVMPLVSTMVVMGTWGQLVVLQSRPVWQQPPPARARHA
jgi:hypothetical protein